MNKTILLLLSFFVSVCTAMAVPAHKGKVSVKQPDGSTVTIRLHGDEYMSFTTTEDGYTVVKTATPLSRTTKDIIVMLLSRAAP